MIYKLSYVGKIYKDHLPVISNDHYILDRENLNSDKTPKVILKKCSSKGLLVFSKLTSLMESTFAINNKKIILTTTEISDRIAEGNLISGRMVKRQIDYFKEAVPHLFKLTSYKNKSYIEINLTDKKNGFINIFALQDSKNEYIKDTTAEILLSYLLDKAAFNFRCGYEFFVEPSQLKTIKADLNLTEKTIISTIEKLKKLEVIKIETEEKAEATEKKNDLLKKEIRFDFMIFNQFKEFIKLVQTQKCMEIKEKREKKIPAQKVDENNFSQTDSIEKKSEEKIKPVQKTDQQNQEITAEEIRKQEELFMQQFNSLFKKKEEPERNYYSSGHGLCKKEFPTSKNLSSENYGHPVGKNWLTPLENYGHVSENSWSSI